MSLQQALPEQQQIHRYYTQGQRKYHQLPHFQSPIQPARNTTLKNSKHNMQPNIDTKEMGMNSKQNAESKHIISTCVEPLTSTFISGFEARSSYFPAHHNRSVHLFEQF